MGNSNRNSPPPPQTATINSPAFQAWLQSRQSGSAAAPVWTSAYCGSASGSSSAYGSGYGSGSGSGSGGGAYGLALISADEASQERIKAIMLEICKRERQK